MSDMTTASHNGAQRATCVVTERVTMLTTQKQKKDAPVAHAPRRVTIPSGMSETAFLRRLAHRGAVIVTDASGNRRAEIGHATRMVDTNGAYTYPTFAPRAHREFVASVNMRQATQDAWDGYPTEHFGRTI